MSSFINPQKIIADVVVGESNFVADFGFGTGAYLKLLSKEVGLLGEVYAFDIQIDVLNRVQREFEEEGITNVKFLHTDLEQEKSTKLADESVDFVLISSLFFQLEDKVTVTKEAYRILKPNGRVLFIEWRDAFYGLGPSKDLVFSETDALTLFKKNHMDLERRIESGNYHYALVFRKK